MTISLNFSGGISHENEVPLDKQKELADKIVAALQPALEEACASGSGGILVGSTTVAFTATATKSL